jgi:PAS domain S-box-containing protein
MSFSIMVSTADQRVVWVSDSFATFCGLPSDQLVGRPILELLSGATQETWASLFSGTGPSDERFHGFGVNLVGDVESVARVELHGARYIDGGRNVMLSLRMAPTPAEWESSEAFIVDVRAAMLADHIYVAYQPIVDIRSGQLNQLEALARWAHPDLGVVGPDVFIPWAERTGVINELGEWILDRACRDIVRMETEGIHIDLSVNASVEQLRHADVSQRSGDVVAAAGLEPERVWIEVTESVLLDADALSSLHSLQAVGFRLVIDDFGTGHANFAYLTRLKADSLKIDTAFVADLGDESTATAIVRSIISLGGELGLEIIAKGIETESQRSQLVDLDCRLGQGWLFSPALHYHDLVATYGASVDSSTSALGPEPSGVEESVRPSATVGQSTRLAGDSPTAPPDDVDFLRFDGLVLDLQRRTMTVDGRLIEPPPKEFDLLTFLAARPGLVFTRAELLQHVWNSNPDWQDLSTVTEHVHRLRAKIDTNPNRPAFLRTVRRRGYSFESPEQGTPDGRVAEPPLGTWVQVDYRVVAADEGMVALLAARTPADLIGREVDDFVAPSSKLALLAGREMRAAGYIPGPQFITLRALDGTDRRCLISNDVTEFGGGLAVIGTARQIVDAPRLTRQMVSGVVADVSDAVIVTDPDLRVLSWNPAAARLYGWSEQEILGHTLHPVIGGDTEYHGSPSWDELQLNGSWTGVLFQRTRDGSMITVASSINLLRDHGVSTGIAMVNRLVQPGLPTVEEPTDVTASLRLTDPSCGTDVEQT